LDRELQYDCYLDGEGSIDCTARSAFEYEP